MSRKKTEGIEVADKVSVEALTTMLAAVELTGAAPYVQLRFSQKSLNKMMSAQAAGEQAKSNKKREPRNFDEDFKQSMHVSADGWHGIPAAALKAAMVSACRLVGIPMTRAKLLIHVKADGFDSESGEGLIRIQGKPEPLISHVINANGSADVRVRAIWHTWSAVAGIEYDAGCISSGDVLNLVYRAGRQVGIGEGRPGSKKSCGMGYGLFDVKAIDQSKLKSRRAA